MPFQLMHLRPSGRELQPPADAGGTLLDLTSLTDQIHGEFLGGDGPARSLGAVEAGFLSRFDGSGLRVRSPIRSPRARPVTPDGVAASGRFPYLREGDVIELEIDRAAQQRLRIRG